MNSADTTSTSIESTPKAAQRQAIYPEERRLIEKVDSHNAVQYCHCLSRSTEPSILTRLEHAWGMKHKTLNLDTRYNIIPLGATLYSLFDKGEWIFISEEHILQSYYAAKDDPTKTPNINKQMIKAVVPSYSPAKWQRKSSRRLGLADNDNDFDSRSSNSVQTRLRRVKNAVVLSHPPGKRRRMQREPSDGLWLDDETLHEFNKLIGINGRYKVMALRISARQTPPGTVYSPHNQISAVLPTCEARVFGTILAQHLILRETEVFIDIL